MPRERTQKAIAKRIDISYLNHPHPLRRWRTISVVVCFVAAGAWMAWAYATRNEQLYNPGHVTGAHAMIEHNCAACHAPDPENRGKFLRAVSDAACLKCHEAPMHAPTQLVRQGDNAKNPLALAVWLKDNGMPQAAPKAGESAAAESADGSAAPTQPADAHHGARLVSAQCASCHVEHRGRDGLTNISSSHCTQCHADVTKSVAEGKQPQIQVKVTAFREGEHPSFGRRLTQNGRMRDPTRLKFNHATHMAIESLKDNCTACHRTSDPRYVSGPTKLDGAPPYLDSKSDALFPASQSDGRYMQPVNFNLHCQECHPIKVPGVKGTFAHEDIDLVRAQVYSAMQQSAMDRYTAGPPAAVEAPGTSSRRRSSSKKDAGPADEGDWLRGELEKLNKNVVAVQKQCAKCHEMEEQKAEVADASRSRRDYDQLVAWMEQMAERNRVVPAMLWGDDADVVLALQSRARRPRSSSSSSPPAEEQPEATEPSATSSPGPGRRSPARPGTSTAKPAPAAPKPKERKPIKSPEFQTTLHTGLTVGPRRWFPASSFDHQAHRHMSCIQCHDSARTSTDTADVLSPDLNTRQAGGHACVDCHRPGEGSAVVKDASGATVVVEGRPAPAGCVACHIYHNHSRERWPDGHPTNSVVVLTSGYVPPPSDPLMATPENPEEGSAEDSATSPEETPEETPAEAPAETPADTTESGETAEAPEAPPAPEEPVSTETADPAPNPATEAPAEEAAPREQSPAQPAPARRARRPRSVGGS